MSPQGGAFLGVEASAMGRCWTGPTAAQDRLAEMFAQGGHAVPVARVLARLGVPPDGAAAHLAPALRDLLPDPMSLRDMGTAAARFLAAVSGSERIAVLADYDVDGGASAALLLTWLRGMGRSATLYVPDRIDEGYGPNAPAMAALAAAHDLILCVDCGTLAHEPIAAARGCDVIVLDHHAGAPTLPPALAVVNPNRQDEDGALGHLCAAAVVFLFLVEANRRLRAEGVTGPELMDMLDLVALATVADVAPLRGVNRAFVRQGLRVMARHGRAGLAALADIAGLGVAPSAHHLGFVLGPRINAGGRVGRADLGARLLATDDPAEAAALAGRLDGLNAERRDIEAAVRHAAIAQAEARGLDGPLAWAAGDGWHPGVVGIVAARLKEAANRPAVVIALDGDLGRGSGRSVAGVDLGAAVHRLAAEGLLMTGGGHPMAAGLSLRRDRVEPAMARLGEILARQGAGLAGAADLMLDGVLAPEAATADLVQALDAAGPWGSGAAAPRFALAGQSTSGLRRMGASHLRFRAGLLGRLDCVAFGAFEGPLGPLLESASGPVHLAGRIEVDHWQGRARVQLRVEDAARAT